MTEHARDHARLKPHRWSARRTVDFSAFAMMGVQAEDCCIVLASGELARNCYAKIRGFGGFVKPRDYVRDFAEFSFSAIVSALARRSIVWTHVGEAAERDLAQAARNASAGLRARSWIPSVLV